MIFLMPRGGPGALLYMACGNVSVRSARLLPGSLTCHRSSSLHCKSFPICPYYAIRAYFCHPQAIPLDARGQRSERYTLRTRGTPLAPLCGYPHDVATSLSPCWSCEAWCRTDRCVPGWMLYTVFVLYVTPRFLASLVAPIFCRGLGGKRTRTNQLTPCTARVFRFVLIMP